MAFSAGLQGLAKHAIWQSPTAMTSMAGIYLHTTHSCIAKEYYDLFFAPVRLPMLHALINHRAQTIKLVNPSRQGPRFYGICGWIKCRVMLLQQPSHRQKLVQSFTTTGQIAPAFNLFNKDCLITSLQGACRSLRRMSPQLAMRLPLARTQLRK